MLPMFQGPHHPTSCILLFLIKQVLSPVLHDVFTQRPLRAVFSSVHSLASYNLLPIGADPPDFFSVKV